jgi:pyruvate/2-oxoglutarate dehydrogenase complex dihydrolipoamide acyltransferase (E2) component
MHEFRLPDVGEGLREAEVVTWLVEVGDRVVEDQPFVELQTDKALVEMPAPATGTVVRLGAKEGAVLQVGEVLAVIDDGAPPAPEPGEAPGSRRGAGAAQGMPARPAGRNGKPLATPATRRLARELGIDLVGVAGTGPGGRITDADVQAAAASPTAAGPANPAATAPPALAGPVAPGARGGRGPASPGAARVPVASGAQRAPAEPESERVPLRGLRRRTAETMTQSWQAIPHITAFHEVDALALLDLRRRLSERAERSGVPLTLTAFLVKAAAIGLVEHPMVNSSLDLEAGEIVLHRRRNVGVAVSTPDGLIVPVVRDADAKSLLAISREVAELSQAARERRVDLAALRGGTFTVTNHGPLGGWFGTPLIRPGEVGILGIGRAQDRPVAVEGQLAVRPVLPLSFAADHRVIDGDLQIAFCLTVKGLLQDPVQLLLGEG